ncbi:MAG: PSP1 C-terminal domain-containing protein [Pirellulaceae bacterium]|nr:PSP1 C-terminal domain-containing protein [Pirellulaceae bacterium]
MSGQHWIRFGAFGSVGRFAAVDSRCYPRGARVVCRTRRGLEIGEVLSPQGDSSDGSADGTLLRGVTAEDDLLIARLEKNRDAAWQACQDRLVAAGIPAVLVDVEHLFDGQSLFFYFLGETTPELDAITAELAETYEAQVQFRKFTDTLTAGCGPGCGTDDAENGCASGACSTCAVVSACGGQRRAASSPAAGS